MQTLCDGWVVTVCVPQHDPPMMITDLFQDVQDGVCLLSLLEVLSGEKLVMLRYTEDLFVLFATRFKPQCNLHLSVLFLACNIV